MNKDTSFHTVTQKLLDAWLHTTPQLPAAPEDIYRDVLELLTIRMRMTLVVLNGDDPLQWHLKVVRSSTVSSRILNINKLFADQRIGEFKDRGYMETAVIPRYREVIATQKPSMELVKTRVLGVNIGYERLIFRKRQRRSIQPGFWRSRTAASCSPRRSSEHAWMRPMKP